MNVQPSPKLRRKCTHRSDKIIVDLIVFYFVKCMVFGEVLEIVRWFSITEEQQGQGAGTMICSTQNL